MRNIAFLALCLLAILVSVANAEARIAPGMPIPKLSLVSSVLDVENASVGGNGCAGGNAVVKLLGENYLQIKLPNLATHGKLDRSACAIVIPVHIQSAEGLIVEGVNVIGEVALKKNAKVTTNIEIFAPGFNGSLKFARIDIGKKNGKFLLKNNKDTQTFTFGGGAPMRINISQLLKSKGANSHAKVSGILLKVKMASGI